MQRRKAGRQAGESRLPEKKWALKPFLETVLSDLNSTRMLLYWEVMTSGFSEPQNLPCSLESAVSPLRTSTKSYLHTCRAAQLQAHLLQEASPGRPHSAGFLFRGSSRLRLPALLNLTTQNSATHVPALPPSTGFLTPRPLFPHATCCLVFKALFLEPPCFPESFTPLHSWYTSVRG